MKGRTDYVYEELMDRLANRHLRPGDLINRRELAVELGVSVSPVNEAVLQLELEGLLETIPRKGTRVRRAGQREVWSLLIARIAIESQAVRMVCGEPLRSMEGQLRQLAASVDEQPDDHPEMMRADVAFHRALVAATDCPSLRWHFDRLMRQGLIILSDQKLTRQERSSHQELVTVLLSAKQDAAERAIRAHIQSGKASLALERGVYEDVVRPALGHSPMVVQSRMGSSMDRLLSAPHARATVS